MKNIVLIEGFIFCRVTFFYENSHPVSSMFLKKEDCTLGNLLSLVRKTYKMGDEDFVKDLLVGQGVTELCNSKYKLKYFFSLDPAVMLDGKVYLPYEFHCRVFAP